VPGGQVNWWVLGALLILGAGAVLPVLQTSSATTRGFDAQRIQAQQEDVRGQIRALEAEVAGMTRLERIERRASEIGLLPGTDPVFITVDVPGPQPAKLPSEYLPGPVLPEGESESWWHSLIELVVPGI
jgi:hypothetical protein